MNDFFFGFGEDVSVGTSKTVSYTCETCGLCNTCESPKVGVLGKGNKGILIINSQATPSDDANGDVMCGGNGVYIEKILSSMDIDMDYDCYRINAIQCFANNNGKMREPSALEIQCCRTRLQRVVKVLKPKVIVTLGITAIQTLIGDRFVGRIKGVNWTDFFGVCIPEWTFNAWLIPTHNPLFFRDNKETRDYDMLVKRAFTMAIEHLDKEVPNYDPNNIKVDVLTDPKEVKKRILNFIDNNAYGAFDYETNCIKAQGSNKKIICTSISNGRDDTFCFPHNEETKKYLRLFLTDKDCEKIAHNATFEHSWSKEHIGVDVVPWIWDTAIGAHCVNSQRSCGLKLQSYLYFGIIGYDAEVDEYIESSAKAEKEYGANALNRISEAPLETVMRYCGIDSWLSARLMPLQKEELRTFNPNAVKMAKFYTDGAIALSKMHIQGMVFDTDIAARNDAKLTEDINAIYGDMYRDFPSWNGKTSGTGLLTFLRNELGLKVDNADKEALEETEHPFCKRLLEIRELEKIRDTFISGLFKECVDGKVHCFFNLTKAKTYRSSSTNVNCQNLSKRNKKAKKYIRTCLVPPKGFRIMEIDYKALESFTGCENYPDDTFLKYAIDESADLHTDISTHILGIDRKAWSALPNEISKQFRTVNKMFTFGSMFGSSGKNSAPKLWGKYSPDVLKVLAKHGLKDYNSFEKKMIETDQWLWGELFKTYGTMRRETYSKYLNDGYVDNLCGFRFQAPIIYTEAVNINVQSLAANLKVGAVIDATNELESRGLKSKLFAEIHDALIFYVANGEENTVWEIAERCMTKNIHTRFPFLKLEYHADAEFSELFENGGNWANMYDATQILFYNYNGINMQDTDIRLCFISKYLPQKYDNLEDAEKAFFSDYALKIKEFIKWQGKQKFVI